MTYNLGMLVTHPLKPEWRPGKVLRVQGDKTTNVIGGLL
jgi:hypothetical protein